MYEGLPIATNKISVEERQSIPHHLLGCIKVHQEPWTVSKFEEQASQVIEQIRSRGKLPIVVGGTHYYLQSLLFKDALVEHGPEQESNKEQEKRWPILAASPVDMLAELKKLDPVMAQRWHPNDIRKVRRSLEIYYTTGRKASEIYEEQQEQRAKSDVPSASHVDRGDMRVANIDRDHQLDRSRSMAPRETSLILWTHAASEILKPRLDSRVDTMLNSRLLAEVEGLYDLQQLQQSADAEVDLSRGIWIAIGYKEFLPYLLATTSGNTTAKELERLRLEGIERTQIRTRQYAKSQIRWINGKLLPALQRENLSQNLYQLDATDLLKWEENVVSVANDIVTAFLQGRTMPESKHSFDATDGKGQSLKDQGNFARKCETCDKIMMSDDAWEGHMSSRKHKATARAKQKALMANGADGEQLSISEDR